MNQAGVIDDNIDWPEAVLRLLSHFLDLLAVRNIELEDLHLFGLGLGLDHILGRLAGLLVNIENRQLAAELCQLDGHKSADTGASTRQEHMLALDTLLEPHTRLLKERGQSVENDKENEPVPFAAESASLVKAHLEISPQEPELHDEGHLEY